MKHFWENAAVLKKTKINLYSLVIPVCVMWVIISIKHPGLAWRIQSAKVKEGYSVVLFSTTVSGLVPGHWGRQFTTNFCFKRLWFQFAPQDKSLAF